MTDDAGNETTCETDVNVVLGTGPTITDCPSEKTISADENCEGTVPDLTGEVAAEDDGSITITQDPEAGTAVGPGTGEVIITVTDDDGNIAACTVDLIVLEDSSPTIVAPEDITVYTDPGSCEATAVDLGSSVTNDNCGVADVTNNAPSSFPTGTTTVIWTATDNAGNDATAAQVVTVIDNELPVINTCAADSTIESDANGDALVPDLTGEITASDNCDANLAITQSPAAGSQITPGITVVTLTVGDDAGNEATCEANVTVVVGTGPVITACAGDKSLIADENCEALVPDLRGEVTATDDGSITITQSPSAGSTIGAGVTEVTLMVTDDEGNTATCTASVAVTENTAPTITAPDDVSVAVDAGSCEATGVDLGTPVTDDNCGIANVTNDAPAVFATGTTTVTWTVTDNTGNIATDVQNVTVTDDQAPAITAPVDLIINNDPGSCEATGIDLGTPVTDDNCGVANVTNDAPAAFTVGTTSVTWTVTDDSENEAAAAQVVTVIDNEAPVITVCASDQTVEADGNGEALVPDLTGEITANDNCDANLAITQSPEAGTTITQGVTTVTLTASDDAGNEETCTTDVNVTVGTGPTITTCAADKTQSADANCEGTVPDLTGEVTATDDGTFTVSQSPSAGSTIGTGVTVVTLTVTDDDGNIATCTASVAVTEDTAPTITAPADVTVGTDAGACEATGVDLGAAVADDNCGVASVTNDAAEPFALGITTVTWTVTDNTGNTETSTQNVIVTDNESPVITTCASDRTLDGDVNGEALVPNITAEITASDNCDTDLSVVQLPAAGTTIPQGLTIITITVTDDAGNNVTCSADIDVVVGTVPNITACATDKTQSADENCGGTVPDLTGEVIAEDDGTFTITQSPAAGTAMGTGVTEVTITVTDDDGNTAECTVTITVVEDSSPSITAPADITVETDPGFCYASGVDLGTPVTDDNCGIANIRENAPSFFPVGSTTFTWTATDGAGNRATASQTVRVEDNEPPVITNCPADISVTANDQYCGNNVSWTQPTASDNCGVTLVASHDPGDFFDAGDTEVIYTATDSYGNVSSCSFIVTVLPAVLNDISGANEVCVPAEEIYTFEQLQGAVYSWTVNEGVITGGPGTNEITVSWDGTDAGTVELTVTSESGCTATKDLNVIKYALPVTGIIKSSESLNRRNPGVQENYEDVRTSSSIEYSIVEGHISGEQYRWEVTGGTITSGGIVTAGANGESVIEFTQDAHTITVNWDQAPAGITSLEASINAQKISLNGCYSQVTTLPINIWNLPTANIIDGDIEICSGDEIPASIEVELNGAPSNSGSDGFVVNYEYVAPRIEDATGSVDGISGTVTSNTDAVAIPLPSVLYNTEDDEDRTFTVNLIVMTDDFDDRNGDLIDGIFNIIVHPMRNTGEIMSRSQSSVSDYVDVVCAGDAGSTYYISGHEGSTYNWTVDGGSIVNDFGDSITVDWNNDAGEYNISVQEMSVNGCYSETVAATVLVSSPFVDLGADTYICEGEMFTLIPEGEYASIEWFDGSAEAAFFTDQEGLISCIVTDEIGCTMADEVYLEVKPLPYVDLGRDTSLCGDASLYLDGGDDAVSFSWSTGDISRELRVFPGYQEITVEVEDIYGCRNSDTLVIDQCNVQDFFSDIQNAITPSNRDGKNDFWQIEKLQAYPDAIVEIYDRWGRLIWRSAPGYPNPWNGRNMNGREVPMDSYHYIIIPNHGNDENIIGSVTVIR